VSTRQTYRLVERSTGNDPAQRHWNVSVRNRGIYRLELLPLAA